MSNSAILATIYLVLGFALAITLLVFWARNREDLRYYTRFGLYAACAFCAFSVVALAVAHFEQGLPMGFLVLTIGLVVDFFKITLVVAVGAYCARLSGYVAFPLIRPRLGLELDEANDAVPHPGHAGTADLRTKAIWVAVLVLAWLGYSKLLFWLFSPEMAQPLQEVLNTLDMSQSMELTAASALAVSAMAISEELIFRLGIQNLLVRLFNWQGRQYWIAVLLTTLLWTIGHTGVLEPDWVKLLQIFPAGLALGWMFRKHGIECCIAAHLLFNLIMPTLGL
ncbi:MAG: CPBP family intramembrane metalloprotease [Gammaproteobacteria bacterium]|nr:CPBP family intramembrane metalloprotease [Gammaproteobacteria bacterium]MDE0245075.1 CPBP family intramembrane metalloprotease [Gammaproteobacteria bacterium]MDE0414846.1 CPBP family intramembrane metalloprotease [Gammaproteobacteria bacterium]